MKIVLGLWRIAHDSFAVFALELAGAVAIVYGVDVQWGAGPAWVAAGVAALLKAFELDLERPPKDLSP